MVAVVVLAGCRGSKDEGAESPASAATVPAASTTAAGGSELSTTAGEHTASIEADGLKRWFIYYVPKSYKSGTAAPLVFALHGGNGSMQDLYSTRGDLIALAERDGFVVVFPNGQNVLGNRGSSVWNAVWCCARAHETNKSDVDFVRGMVSALSGALTIDPKRIHAVGFSNGGMLGYRLAAEMPDTLASVVVTGAVAGGRDTVTGQMTRTQPSKPVPLLIMHGLVDRTAPVEGGQSAQFPELFYLSQVESLAIYTSAYHCGATPAASSIQGSKGRVRVNRYTCDADLVTMLMEGVAHGWPDTEFAGFDGTAEAWEFMKAHPRP